MATAIKSVDYAAILEKWKADVEDIVGQMEGWFRTHPSLDHVKQFPVTLHEANMPKYKVTGIDAFFKSKYQDRIEVRPLGRRYPDRGDILITSHTNLRRVFLLQNVDGIGWKIYADSQLPIHLDLNEIDFHTLINDLRDEI